MESYKALRRAAHKKDFTKLTIAGGALIAAYAIFRGDYIYVLIGAVIVYVALYSKDVIISDEGMTSHYHGIFYNKTRTYPLSDFGELRVVRNPGAETVIGFVRNGMNTNCLFTSEDGEAVVELVKKHNPGIYIREGQGRRRSGL